MTFLAHWKISGTPGASMNGQAAVDSAAGGSGAHDGVYRLTDVEALGVVGYDENLSLQGSISTTDGIIDSIANVSDLQLTGTYSVMAWFLPVNILNNDMYIFNVGGSGETLATNHLIWIEVLSNGAIRVLWEYGAGTNVDISSTSGIISAIRWHHIAVIRYPIAANYGVKFYIDGVLVDTKDNGGPGYTPAAGGTSATAYIGRTADDSGAADHYRVDSIRVYDTDESANVINVYTTEKNSFTTNFTFQSNVPTITNDARNPNYLGLANALPTVNRDERKSSHAGFAYTGPKLLLEGNVNAGFHR